MKKIILLMLSLSIVLGCVACAKKSDDSDIKDVSVSDSETSCTSVNTDAESDRGEVLTDASDFTDNVYTTVLTDAPAESSSVSVPSENPDGKVSVYTESFVSGECSVNISYPRYGTADHELFDISMRSLAMQKYNSSGMMPEDNALYEVTACDIKYESDVLVSAVVTGHIINNTAAHDSYFIYTVNADPKTGRIYTSDELIGDLEQIKLGIAEKKFTQSIGVDGIMEEMNPEDITMSWRSDYGVFPGMYFTSDSFGVVAELSYALGGYAGFEIPYSDMENMINDTAKILCGLIVVD